MLSWLLEEVAIIYMLLGTILLVAAALWWRTRHNKYLIGAALTVVFIGVLALLAYFVETDDKRIAKAVQVMAAGVKARDLDRVFRHLSEQFHIGGHDKASFRRFAENAIRSHNVEDVIVWDFDGAKGSGKTMRRMAFKVKVRGNWSGGADHYLCVAEFALEQGQWRMLGFQIFNPFMETTRPIPIPGL
jgi:hypothetical protein